MKITETKKEKLSRSYQVIVPAATINEQIDAKLQELSGNVKMPGFRSGKVPLTILRQRYRREVLGEVLQEFADTAGQKIIADNKLENATQPKMNLEKFDDDDDLEFSVIIDLKPEIELGDLSKIKADKLSVAIEDADIDNGLQSLANESGEAKPITEKRACKAGDEVLMDFKGFKDGVAFEGGEAQGFSLKLGAGNMIPGFEEAIIGKKAGETFRFNVTFPENYQAPNLAGAETEFEITLHEISEIAPVAIDDELAKKYGQKDLNELKDALKSNINEQYRTSISRVTKRQIFDSIEKLYPFELPANLVEGEFDSIWQQIEQIQQAGQIDEEDKNKSDKELKKEYREIAERRLRMAFFIDKFCETHDIQATDQEIEQLIRMEAARNPAQAKEINDYYQKNPSMRKNLASPILEEKAINKLMEHISLTEKTVTVEELMALEEERTSSGSGKAKKPKKASKPKNDKKAAKKGKDK